MPEPTNAPEFSVSELSGAIKRTLETAFARIRVRGEVTEAKTYPSGHTYFLPEGRGRKDPCRHLEDVGRPRRAEAGRTGWR